jgi:hypothetical protein
MKHNIIIILIIIIITAHGFALKHVWHMHKHTVRDTQNLPESWEG